jgi:glycosyltransferase involved in cell wall biosynthesis
MVTTGRDAQSAALERETDVAIVNAMRELTHLLDIEQRWWASELATARRAAALLDLAADATTPVPPPLPTRRLVRTVVARAARRVPGGGRLVTAVRRKARVGRPSAADASSAAAGIGPIAERYGPLVSVIADVTVATRAADVFAALGSQTLTHWQLVLIDRRPPGAPPLERLLPADGRWVVVPDWPGAVRAARGTYLTTIGIEDPLPGPVALESAALGAEERWSSSDVGAAPGATPCPRWLCPDAATPYAVVVAAGSDPRRPWPARPLPAARRHGLGDRSGAEILVVDPELAVGPDPVPLPDEEDSYVELLHRLPRRAVRDPLQPVCRQTPGNALKRLEEPWWQLPAGQGRPVVLFVPFLAAGSAIHAIARGFRDEGRTVVVVVTDVLRPGLVDATAAMTALTPYVYDLPTMLRPPLWREFGLALRRRLTDPVFVTIGSHWFLRNVGALREPALGAITVIDVEFNNQGHVPGNLAAGGAVDVTAAAYERLTELLRERRTAGRVVTVPIAIDEPPPRSKQDARARLGLAPGDPIVAWVGRAAPEKQPLAFVELARRLQGRGRFVMAGSGPLVDEVRRAGADVPGFAHLGFVEDPLDVMAAADVLVMTSATEGIPLVAMEAISLGTPVVAYDVGGLDEVVREDTGRLVGLDDLDALTESVHTLLVDDLLRARLQHSTGAAGLHERFSMAAMAAGFSGLANGTGHTPD